VGPSLLPPNPESRHSRLSETKTRGRTVPAVSSAAAVVVDGHIGPSFFQVNKLSAGGRNFFQNPVGNAQCANFIPACASYRYGLSAVAIFEPNSVLTRE